MRRVEEGGGWGGFGTCVCMMIYLCREREQKDCSRIYLMFQWLHQKFAFPWFLLPSTVQSRAASVVLTEVPGGGRRCHSSPHPDGVHCRTHTGEPCRQFSLLLSLAYNMYLIEATPTCCLALFHHHALRSREALRTRVHVHVLVC